MSAPRGPDVQDDEALDQLLSDSLRGVAMGELSHARMRATVQAEWRQSVVATRRSHWQRWLPAAAAILAVAMAWTGWLVLRPAEVFGDLQASMGDPRLRVGQHFEVQSNLLVALRGGGQLRARQGSTLELVAQGTVRLVSGVVYIDAQGRPSTDPLRVLTPQGLVQHVGTQFEVAIMTDGVRVRVREGSVRLRDALRVDAGEQVILTSDGTTQRASFAPYDNEWRWLATPVADVAVDGRNLSYLLRWVARETGRRLEFADERSSALADTTILHGSVAGLEPDLALRAMLATTTLQADVLVDRIVVHSRDVATRS